MKAFAVVGSKRKHGNTHILTKELMDSLETFGVETELQFLSDFDFEGCRGCGGCDHSTTCVVKDDMQLFYKKMHEADILILASPTYYYNVSGDMKKFIDRFFCLNIFDEEDRSIWTSLYKTEGGKAAATITVCEQLTHDAIGFTTEAMRRPLEDIGCTVVESLEALHVYKKGEILTQTETLNQTKRIAELLFSEAKKKTLDIPKF